MNSNSILLGKWAMVWRTGWVNLFHVRVWEANVGFGIFGIFFFFGGGEKGFEKFTYSKQGILYAFIR